MYTTLSKEFPTYATEVLANRGKAPLCTFNMESVVDKVAMALHASSKNIIASILCIHKNSPTTGAT